MRATWLPSDLIAGALLAAIAIPEQVATARLAGMPPQTGLVAFAAGTLAFAAFGVNRYISVGADSTIAPIFAGSIAALVGSGSTQYASFVTVTALLAGVVLVLAGVARAGWIADLLSIPVTIGLLAGISAHIVIGQLPLVLGVPAPSGPLVVRALDLLRHLPAANLPSAILGFGVLAVTLAGDRISRRFPGALVALGLATIAVVALHLEPRGVAVLGRLDARFPALRIPSFDPNDLLRVVPIALIVALVCMVQTSTVVRAFPSDSSAPDEAGRDFGAVGVGSIVAAFFGSFAVDASPPRTAIVAQTGGRSQLAGIFAVAVVAVVVAFGAGLAAHLPLAALGGVLIWIGLRIFRVPDMLRIARGGDAEIWFVLAAAGFVVLFPIETGMLLAIALSLARGIYAVARPPSAEYVRVPGTTIWWPAGGDSGEREPGVVVFAPAAPLAFTNARYIVGRLRAAVAAAPQPVRIVVLECAGVSDIDYTGSLVLRAALRELRARSIRVAVARLSNPRAQADALRSGVLAELGDGCLYKSVNEALIAIDSQ